MIEIGERRVDVKGDYEGHIIYIEGAPLSKEQCSAYESGFGDGIDVDIFDTEVTPKFNNLKFTDVPLTIKSLGLPIDSGFPDFENIDKRFFRADDEAVTLAFSFSFDFGVWKNPWSMSDFIEELKCIWREHSIEGATFESEHYIPNFTLKCQINDLTSTFGAEERKFLGPMCQLIQSTYDSLAAKAHGDALVAHFNFPEEKRVACEQYLLYFVQFLKDLGVEANAKLESEQGQVLFAVTPANGQEALDKIREALGIYLNLPFQPGLQTAGNTATEIEV